MYVGKVFLDKEIYPLLIRERGGKKPVGYQQKTDGEGGRMGRGRPTSSSSVRYPPRQPSAGLGTRSTWPADQERASR